MIKEGKISFGSQIVSIMLLLKTQQYKFGAAAFIIREEKEAGVMLSSLAHFDLGQNPILSSGATHI